MFPIALAVTTLSGTGHDAVFMGLIRPLNAATDAPGELSAWQCLCLYALHHFALMWCAWQPLGTALQQPTFVQKCLRTVGLSCLIA